MKYIFPLLMILIFDTPSFAQDTAVVKQQAILLTQATMRLDVKTLVEHTYPKIVEIAGGEEKMIAIADSAMKKLIMRGITIENVIIGAPGKFYTAEDEIHCLVPETLVLKLSNGRAISKGYLLAISADGGKTWTFADISKYDNESIEELFPNFNHELKIPEPTKLIFQKN